MRGILGGPSGPTDRDDPRDASEAVSTPAVEEAAPSAEDRAWDVAIVRWIDAELRSTPVSQHPPGWDHLLNVALPKLRSYVESELEISRSV